MYHTNENNLKLPSFSSFVQQVEQDRKVSSEKNILIKQQQQERTGYVSYHTCISKNVPRSTCNSSENNNFPTGTITNEVQHVQRKHLEKQKNTVIQSVSKTPIGSSSLGNNRTHSSLINNNIRNSTESNVKEQEKNTRKFHFIQKNDMTKRSKLYGKTLPFETIQKYFHLPITEASEELGCSVTKLKRMCRKLEIKKWPYRKGGKRLLNESIPTRNSPVYIGENNAVTVEGTNKTVCSAKSPTKKEDLKFPDDIWTIAPRDINWSKKDS